MDELNFFPFYYELFRNQENESGDQNSSDCPESSFIEWRQEYEIINISHQLEFGW